MTEEEIDEDFLDWVMRDRPPISEASKKLWGEVDEENTRTLLEIPDEELLENSGHDFEMYMEWSRNKRDAISAKNILEGEYDDEVRDEKYEHLVYKYGDEWRDETKEYDEPDYDSEVGY